MFCVESAAVEEPVRAGCSIGGDASFSDIPGFGGTVCNRVQSSYKGNATQAQCKKENPS